MSGVMVTRSFALLHCAQDDKFFKKDLFMKIVILHAAKGRGSKNPEQNYCPRINWRAPCPSK